MEESPNSSWCVEIAEGGPWLAQDLTVAIQWKERGVWPTPEEARQAAEKSLAQPGPST